MFHYRSKDTKLNGANGQHVINWSMPREPRVQTSYAPGTTGPLDETWQRIDPAPEPAIVNPEGQGPDIVVPPDASERPDFGEYVYVEELPEAVTKAPPVYPDEARRAGVEGTVVVQALVLKDGSVGDTRIVKSVPGLDEAAVSCVRQWHFKPAMTKGRPVEVWVAVPVKFSLH